MSEVVRSSVRVDIDPDAAFALFTDEIDSWWKRGERFRFDPDRDGRLAFENDQLIERFEDGDTFVVGAVLGWDPPSHLAFEFRAAKFAPGETTRVDVTFEPELSGTRVNVEHSGWEALKHRHPSRHGLKGPAFVHLMGVWWADLLQGLRPG